MQFHGTQIKNDEVFFEIADHLIPCGALVP